MRTYGPQIQSQTPFGRQFDRNFGVNALLLIRVISTDLPPHYEEKFEGIFFLCAAPTAVIHRLAELLTIIVAENGPAKHGRQT